MGLKMGARGRVLLPKALPRAQGFELGAQDLTISSFLKGFFCIYRREGESADPGPEPLGIVMNSHAENASWFF